MRELLAIFRGEYDTLRDLERKTFRIFYVGGGIAGLGLLFCITGVLIFVGIPLVILGATIFFAAMVWMSKLQKEPVRAVYCPYCSSKNDVFLTRRDVVCDICGRRMNISVSGEVVGMEPEAEAY